MKKKIAFITASPVTINAFLVPQIKALSEQYEVFVITNAGEQETNLNAVLGRVTLISVPLARKIDPLRDLISLIKLIRIFRKEKFWLIHSFISKAGLLSAVAGKIVGIPNRLHTFTGQVWVTASGFKRYLLKSLDKLTVRLDTKLLVDSVSQRDYLINNQVLDKSDKSSVLGEGSISGVELDRFRPRPEEKANGRRKYGIAQDSVVFLYIGRIKEDKGVLDLIEAFRKLKEKIKTVALVMVGQDEENLIPQIKKKLAQHEESLRIFPHTDCPEKIMALSDVLCLPSYREGFGTVVIEAAACAIPAIASDIYGLTDAVVDAETGFLFPVKNIEKLADVMYVMATDGALRAMLSQNAFKRACEKFSHKKIVSAWLELYETLT